MGRFLKYNGSYKDLSYQIGGNVSFSRRKTTKVYNPIFSTSLNYYRDNTANRWEGGFWGYESAGQFTSQEQIDNWKIDNDGKGNRTMRPGDIIYKDLNNDGRITDLDMRKNRLFRRFTSFKLRYKHQRQLERF